MLAGTSLAGSPSSPILAVDPDWRRRSTTGEGQAGRLGLLPSARRAESSRLRTVLEDLDRRVRRAIEVSISENGETDPGGRAGRARLAIDRAFAVKGRGAVVTGTLRGGSLVRGATLRLVPGGRAVRVRDIEVHGVAVEVAGPGRTALNVAGVDIDDLGRGLVVTDDPAVVATDRLLVRLARRAARPGACSGPYRDRGGRRCAQSERSRCDRASRRLGGRDRPARDAGRGETGRPVRPSPHLRR